MHAERLRAAAALPIAASPDPPHDPVLPGAGGSAVAVADALAAAAASAEQVRRLTAELAARDAEIDAAQAVVRIHADERSRHEARLHQAHNALIHASRQSAMAAMAATLAHELNQPLTAVANYVRGCRALLAVQATDAQPGLAVALAATEASALRAGDVVRRLRDTVATGKLRCEHAALPALIEDAAVIAAMDAQAVGVEMHFLFGGFDGAVMVDRVQIQQVLINLVRNAIEATCGRAHRQIVIATRRIDATLAEVRVTDDGPGLAAAVRPDLFAPLNTTEPGGMGMGLAICRTIVEAHGGTIGAESAPEGGAVVAFTLPIAGG